MSKFHDGVSPFPVFPDDYDFKPPPVQASEIQAPRITASRIRPTPVREAIQAVKKDFRAMLGFLAIGALVWFGIGAVAVYLTGWSLALVLAVMLSGQEIGRQAGKAFAQHLAERGEK